MTDLIRLVIGYPILKALCCATPLDIQYILAALFSELNQHLRTVTGTMSDLVRNGKKTVDGSDSGGRSMVENTRLCCCPTDCLDEPGVNSLP